MSWLLLCLLFAASIIILIVFLRWEQKTVEPIVDLALLRKRPFLAANVYNLIYGTCVLGVFTLVPLYAVSVYGMSTFESGFIMTPRSVAMVIMSAIASFALMRWGYRRPILIGTVAITLSLFLLALEPQGIEVMGLHLNATVLLWIIMLISGIGFGAVIPAANNACIELMPDKVATITGVRIMFRQIGSTIGIALSTVIIHVLVDARYAFHVLLLGWAVVMILSVIVVFAMPSRPNSSVCLPERVKQKQ